MAGERKAAKSFALVVQSPAMLAPADATMFEAIALRYARSELSPSWAQHKADNVFIAMVNGHALGLHPAVAVNQGFVVNGHYDLFGQAYLALAQGRDPAFRYAIEEWTDQAIKLAGWREGVDGGVKHEVAITYAQMMKNAATAKNPSALSNPKDHLMWKASKRLVKLVTPAVTLGLPLPSEEQIESEPEAPRPIDAGRALEAAAVAGTQAGAAPETPVAAPTAATREDARTTLGKRLEARFGKMTKPEALQKASIIFNLMAQEASGKNPGKVYGKVTDISDADAQRMIEYLDKNPEQRHARATATEAVTRAATEASRGREPTPAPPLEEEVPAAAPPPMEAQASGPYTFEEFVRVVERARGLFKPRRFLQEDPEGSGVWWYTDQQSLAEIGVSQTTLLQEGGVLAIDVAQLEALGDALTKVCEKKERGR